MSGAHIQHRTGNRPLTVDGAVVLKLDNRGRPVQEHRLIPLPLNAKGRPVGYNVITTFAQAHVLDYSPAPHYPSKHARGRTRPRTAKEQRRAESLLRRYAQLSKNHTLRQHQLDEMAALELAAL